MLLCQTRRTFYKARKRLENSETVARIWRANISSSPRFHINARQQPALELTCVFPFISLSLSPPPRKDAEISAFHIIKAKKKKVKKIVQLWFSLWRTETRDDTKQHFLLLFANNELFSLPSIFCLLKIYLITIFSIFRHSPKNRTLLNFFLH